MKNLAIAVLNVMKTVKGIEKNAEVGRGNMAYKGVSDQEVKKIIGKAMEENGLVLLPIEVNPTTTVSRWQEQSEYQGKTTVKQKQSVFTEVTTKYLLLHETGESQVISGYGHGVDSQDKGAGKSTTYALKYALLYTFLVPTGDIDDSDSNHSEDIEVPRLPALTSDQFAATKKGTISQIETVLTKFRMSDSEREELTKILNKKKAE